MLIEIIESDNEDRSNEPIRNQIEIMAKGHSVHTTALKPIELDEIDFKITDTVSTSARLDEKITRKVIGLDEVAEHTSEYDCWIVLYDRVYDVTKFLYEVIIKRQFCFDVFLKITYQMIIFDCAYSCRDINLFIEKNVFFLYFSTKSIRAERT